MKILVLFGSKSDEKTYGPLCESLSEHDVSMEVLSAHRDPEQLDIRLGKNDYDVVLAGAGIAAHLPGVVASKIQKPVFGIPVPAQLGGLDALLSIMQMPFGVPVLTIGNNNEMLLKDYLAAFEAIKSKDIINLVINEKTFNEPWVSKEYKRFREFAEESKKEIIVSNEVRPDILNIVYVTTEEEIRKQTNTIHVPLLSDEQKTDYKEALKLLNWTNKGGLWVGINNSRNALKSIIKWETL